MIESIAVFSYFKIHNYHRIQQFQFWVFFFFKENKKINFKRYIYPYVHYNSQDTEVTCVSIDK